VAHGGIVEKVTDAVVRHPCVDLHILVAPLQRCCDRKGVRIAYLKVDNFSEVGHPRTHSTPNEQDTIHLEAFHLCRSERQTLWECAALDTNRKGHPRILDAELNL